LNTLLIKSPREGYHSARVRKLCELFGEAYGLGADDIKELGMAGELHDIGKIAVDETILNKSGPLTPTEWVQIKHHPEIGYRLLGATAEFNHIAECVLAHHERWDGGGYPKGIKGEEILWKARVIAVADAFDAMTCARPYRDAMSTEAAAAELKASAGTQYDPDIVKVFVDKVIGKIK
jgi:HD-GYP domain-containing protein (c-di-GMP phosphodiesterase class II)